MTPELARGAGILVRGLLDLYPEEAARKLEAAPLGESARLLEEVPTGISVRILERLTADTAARIMERMNEKAVSPVLQGFDAPRAVAVLAQMNEEPRARLLGLLEPETARELRELSSYPRDSAGALMDPRVLAVHPDTTVKDCLRRLRAFRDRKVRRAFLVDQAGLLVGSVRLQELALAAPSDPLRQHMRPDPVSIRATSSREEVVETLTRYKLGSLPVVDFEGRLLGVIRHDALIRATAEQVSADVQSMVGASREERALSKVSFAVKKRLPWLEINLATAFLAAGVVGIFEETIAKYTALAVLLPVVAGQSGNTGAQALAVTMRGLALREVRTRHWLRICLKESSVGLINGIAVALTTATAVYLWSRSLGLALVIGCSMVISMVAAGCSGAAIPMLLTAAGQDPAQSSSIVLTTVTDVVGFFSFLGIATLFMAML